MTRMIRVVLPALLIALCVVPSFGSVLVRYCDGLDWANKKCTGNCYISYQDVPGANETAWAWGPRGQKDSICVEWWGTVATTAGQCIIADADDGAQVFINNKLVIDKWNSHDVRGCPSKKGCATASGKLYIIYYNDYGKAHFSLKTGTCGAAESSFTALTAAAFTGTPAIPADLVGQKLVKITNATCCYPTLAGAAGCGTKPSCDDVLPWVEIASIGKTSTVSKTTFWIGDGEYSLVGPYVLPCTQSLYVGTNGSNSEWLNGDNVVLKVTMGQNVDYYKPLPGYNLCDMLASNRLHLWSKTGKPFTFIQPRYHNSDNTIGGSDNDWPKQFIPGDGRNYLNFWGGNGANGACCHDTPTSPSQWNREALLEVVPQLPSISRPAVNNALPSWTKPVSTWLPFAWAHPDWQMEWQQYYPLTENGVLNDWTGLNSGLYYYRSCGTYNQTGAGGLSDPSKFIFAICMGTTVDATVNCTGQVDYFRAAVPGNNFCDVLRSKNLYEWAYDSSDPNPNNWKWARPEPYYNHFGGARDGWPVAFCKNQCQGVYQSKETCGYDPACYWKADWNSCLNNPNSTVPSPRCSEVRKYLPFWGGHYGGHGYLDAKLGEGVNAGQPQWRRSYTLRLAKIDTTK